jgi:hypothetical protein
VSIQLGSSYFGNRIMRHVEADMKSLVDMGCNLVVHTMSENDFRFYYKTMQEIVALSQSLGLETYIDPWGLGKIFGGEAFSEYISYNPHTRQVLSDGTTGPLACLNHPEFQAFMGEWVDGALDTGADMIFWDEPHFYIASWALRSDDAWGCRCKYCKKLFEEHYSKPMPEEFTDEVGEFRDDCMMNFLGKYTEKVRAAGKKNSVCFFPSEDPKSGKINWDKIRQVPAVDEFGTDPYWVHGSEIKPVDQFVRTCTEQAKRVCDDMDIRCQIWIQGFRIPSGREEEVRTAIHTALDAGARNLAVWGFDACKHISSIAPDDPDKVWAIIREEFQAAREKYG